MMVTSSVSQCSSWLQWKTRGRRPSTVKGVGTIFLLFDTIKLHLENEIYAESGKVKRPGSLSIYSHTVITPQSLKTYIMMALLVLALIESCDVAIKKKKLIYIKTKYFCASTFL